MGNAANPPGGAGRLIEHPGRNLQPSVGCRARDAAAENLLANLLDHLMNVDLATCPRMPRIKKFTLLGPVGALSSCCTIPSARTRRWATGHRHRRRSSGLLQTLDQRHRQRLPWRHGRSCTNIKPGPPNGSRPRPSRLFQIGRAGSIVRKKPLETGKRFRKREVFSVKNVHGRPPSDPRSSGYGRQADRKGLRLCCSPRRHKALRLARPATSPCHQARNRVSQALHRGSRRR